MGVVMALASSGFVLGVGALGALRGTASAHLPETLQALSPFAPLLTLLLAAGAVLLVRRLFSITRWHGPADSILAAHQSGNTLDVKAGLGSTLAAFLSAGGGASVGQYGPLVHFGATVAALVAKLRRTRVRADTFIGCGVAAAISAGFNAPLAGMSLPTKRFCGITPGAPSPRSPSPLSPLPQRRSGFSGGRWCFPWNQSPSLLSRSCPSY